MEIIGVGNALMDLIAFVDEDFAPSLGFHNNSTVHLSHEALRPVISALPDAIQSAGGGSANTARAAALLGLPASFLGAVGLDQYGERYREEMASAGVSAFLRSSPAPTGLFCSLVRPDGGRTILVAPGAAPDVGRESPPDSLFRPGALLYLEGFLLRNRDFFIACLEGARSAGMNVALDLGSQSLVRHEREFLLEIIQRYIDFVFANEDEFTALTALPMAEGLEFLGGEDFSVVVKLAERGAVYARRGEIIASPVRAQRPLDETGAGDAFAAGFLAGAAKGLAPERCLRLGNRIAEEVLRVPGLLVERDRLAIAGEIVAA